MASLQTKVVIVNSRKLEVSCNLTPSKPATIQRCLCFRSPITTQELQVDKALQQQQWTVSLCTRQRTVCHRLIAILQNACMSDIQYVAHSKPQCKADLAVLVNIMVHHLPILLTLILDIIANVQVPVGVCLTAGPCISPLGSINGQHQHVEKLDHYALLKTSLSTAVVYIKAAQRYCFSAQRRLSFVLP